MGALSDHERDRVEGRHHYPEDDMEISLIELVLIVFRARWFIVSVVVLCVVVAGAVGMMGERTYEVDASFSVSNSRYIRLGVGEEVRPDIGVLLGILNSTKLAEAVADELSLMELYETESRALAASRVRNQVNVSTNRDQTVVTISMNHPDRHLARDVVEAYLRNFITINREVNLGEAEAALAFVGERLKEVEVELAEAEQELQLFQNRYGIFSLDSQSSSMAEHYMKSRERLRNLQIEYAVQRSTMSQGHPQLRAVETEIAEVERQLAAMEEGRYSATDSGELPVAVEMGLKDLPRIRLQLSRLEQEVEIQRSSYNTLRTQQESLKVEAAKTSDIIRVIDPPRLPEQPVGRGLMLKLVIGAVLGGMISVMLVFIRESLSKAGLDRETLEEFPLLAKLIGEKSSSHRSVKV